MDVDLKINNLTNGLPPAIEGGRMEFKMKKWTISDISNPTLRKKLNPIIPGLLSDDLFNAIEKMKYDSNKNPKGLISTQWIHLADAVSRGYVSPMEAYDCVRIGYVLEHIKIRDSNYKHLL